MRSQLFALLKPVVCCLADTCVGCGGDAGDFLPADTCRIPTDCCLDSIVSGDINNDGLTDSGTENGENIVFLFQDFTTSGNFLRPQTIFVGQRTKAI